MLPPFHNEPILTFSDPADRSSMEAAISLVRSQLNRDYPLRIGDEQLTTGEWIVSVNPADPAEIVGRTASANGDLARRAIEAAHRAFPAWSHTPPESRARCILKAAHIIRRRRFEFAAWLVFEASKSWQEAYADMAEVIDFLEFYGREMIRLGGMHPTTPWAGEENGVVYIPLGVGVVISPWNFPLAIMGGMTAAAIVTGNTVVVKPASQAPIVAAKFCEVLSEAGVPPGVVNFLPGPGSQVGDLLVDDAKTRFIAFTGSKEVGVRIFSRAAVVHPGQKWLKRTILEMGGKDAIIVDETADLESAADGIVASAFGFQGQKCSACSRLIAVRSIVDPLVAMVADRTRALRIGDPAQYGVDLGAVIEAGAQRKIQNYIAAGRNEGNTVLADLPVPERGYYVSPTIIGGVSADATIAQEEIFGPVLAVVPADTFDDALAIANGTEYGLTGALYSQDRSRLEQARREFHVGNLYLNRKCTGALVDVQPFGGFNMSGTDSKAGGRDYLHLFMQGKSITERF